MLSKIIRYSIRNKLLVFIFVSFIVVFGMYSVSQIPIGAVPDVTNNQVQVITTSQNLSTQDIEQFITYPIELEMSNLPGVIEIRSVSKFGLSVVTIVFEEKMGTYLPRQLISEKLIAVRENIPDGFGMPEMGPITTGLGEIYQYILDVEEEYKDEYDATKLRTIQDWIVKRQLSGIKGVVEVNTWGGFLKQYEIAINTKKLKAMNITISDIFVALKKNNSVAGGGYIEKMNQSYFIRGEGLIESLEDIKNTVVTNKSGIPILIKDVANVGYGSATRFGAITANGEGEKVLGQVMMLKGGNSKKVVESVLSRIKLIQKTLPKGVRINGFLDRSELISKTTFTVYENLILGSLIVIFVVVLLLGNWRSGLVVASVIPLSLMFTLCMMYIFGVDANLMSLGAIDFGIIIDGAVIIIEYVAFQINSNRYKFDKLNEEYSQKNRDDITYMATSKMMSHAIFGQIIILIVFIPIFVLTGVEGKMFKPMAMTFSFALIGAMILGLTYVPAMASLVIRPNDTSGAYSIKLMDFMNKIYEPILRMALKFKKIVLSISILILAISFYIFSTLGAEFVPTLDEGDFVIQPILKTGTSLKKTVEITTEIENIIKQFPEVKQVVSRIGAAEVPTDPMSMEESDIIITLKPKGEWTTAETKNGLADKFKQAIEIIPNIEVEFTQPIEMRFNELISGVRSDIAVKIYGEDLDILNEKANKIKKLIEKVDGAADIIVEKTVGLPQMNIKFDRNKIARYGLNIKDINDLISMGFSGMTVGSIFEGEKKFDLVVRLDKNNRQGINDIRNLFIDLPNGNKIPLSEVAKISYKKGVAKISRDNTRRRVVVGVNVRDRDLQSVVEDIRAVVDEKIKLPVGYSISYGGQFENLQSAKARLSVAVPISLVLIFILLFFAFNSVRDALIIYTAIPFASIGGILLLYIRGLPFSVSASVGFIALFGIAVLNGIVLIEEFKGLKNKGVAHSDDLLINGAKNRLRAVLLTALSAALGFLPMAISNGAGAEVQRPLATVVIGGLITSTLLTLIMLPVLYSIFNNKRKFFKFKVNKKIIVVFLLISIGSVNAQNNHISLDSIKKMSYENNNMLKAKKMIIEKNRILASAPNVISKTQLYYQYEGDKITATQGILNSFGFIQGFKLPSVYKANENYKNSEVDVAIADYLALKQQVDYSLDAAYQEYLLLKQQEFIYDYLDSLYGEFVSNANRKFELGEINYLEKIIAESKYSQVKIQYNQTLKDIDVSKIKIKQLVQSKEYFDIEVLDFDKLILVDLDINNSEMLKVFEARQNAILYKTKLSRKDLLPDFNIQYSYGYNTHYLGDINILQVGMNISLFRSNIKSKIKANKIEGDYLDIEKENYIYKLLSKQQQLLLEMEKYELQLSYFKKNGENLAETILKTANKSFREGEIDFFQYIQSIENSYSIKLDYLDTLYKYNLIVLQINNSII